VVKLLGGPLVHAGDRVEQVTLVGEREDQPVDLVGEHAGHFVKMVHSGIEYGVLAAYAEGLNIIHNANVGKAEHEADAETTLDVCLSL
jgi:6-phosphogluconate dehydrogenase